MKMLVKGTERPIPQKEVLFYLEQTSHGVAVKAQLNEKEWAWNILEFTNDGKVFRFGGIDSSLGLELDVMGCIKII